MSKLSDFYSHGGTDNNGRCLADMWSFTNDEFETVHEYIQWLFPLKVASQFNPYAPILTDEDIETIDKILIRHSFNVMCDFYGIQNNGVGLVKDPNTWNHRSTVWLTKDNHNFLRLTRIIKCLTLFGLNQEATILTMFLTDLYDEYKDVIGETTLSFWLAASEKE